MLLLLGLFVLLLFYSAATTAELTTQAVEFSFSLLLWLLQMRKGARFLPLEIIAKQPLNSNRAVLLVNYKMVE